MSLGPRILVRRPSPRLADGELTHLTRSPVDPDLALRQWEGYVAVFADRGWAVTEVEPADEHPDGVFVEDTAVMVPAPDGPDLAVLTRPGAASRQGEVASTARALDALRIRTAAITAPGTLDGGDVLKVGRTAYVGSGGRSNDVGIAQLAAMATPRGWTVVPVPITTVLHLKSGVTALPDGTVIGHSPRATPPAPDLEVPERGDEIGALAGRDDPALLPDLLVPEKHGAAVVDLGGGAVVLSAAAPRTAALLRDRGLEVLPVPVTEFEKLEGCVTCLSIRLRP